ncbi:MAG: hypothetical protein ACREVI_00385 [Steroidobacteraceae bacterium]
MRIVSRTTRSLLEQQREKSLRKRQAAGTLAKSFPQVEQVRVQLRFIATAESAPSAQVHALYPSAPAYFEFACPHGDCDGSIDLNDIALPLLRRSARQAEGTFKCTGTRTAGGMARQPCNQRTDYWIAAQYQAITRATG